MPRHQTLINTATRSSTGRRGQEYPLDRLTIAGTTLYYAHTMPRPAYIRYLERWLIADQHWVVNRFTLRAEMPAPSRWIPGYHWYVDLDRITVDGDIWRLDDCYLDVIIYDRQRYEILDADELADGIGQGDLPLEDVMSSLRALDALARALRGNGCSGEALLDEYASGLPH